MAGTCKQAGRAAGRQAGRHIVIVRGCKGRAAQRPAAGLTGTPHHNSGQTPMHALRWPMPGDRHVPCTAQETAPERQPPPAGAALTVLPQHQWKSDRPATCSATGGIRAGVPVMDMPIGFHVIHTTNKAHALYQTTSTEAAPAILARLPPSGPPPRTPQRPSASARHLCCLAGTDPPAVTQAQPVPAARLMPGDCAAEQHPRSSSTCARLSQLIAAAAGSAPSCPAGR